MTPLTDFDKKLQKAMGVEKKTPRITVNKLGEYMDATAIRRRQIIKEAKNPQGWGGYRYNEVHACAKQFFINQYDEQLIEECLIDIGNKEKDTRWKENDGGNSELALNHLLVADLPDLDHCAVKGFDEENQLIELGGINISVNPDLIVTTEKEKIGAIKFHLSKTHVLSEASRGYVATTLKYFLMQTGHDDKSIDHNVCISFDVFGETFTHGSRAYKRDLNALEAACEEIRSRWDTI